MPALGGWRLKSYHHSVSVLSGPLGPWISVSGVPWSCLPGPLDLELDPGVQGGAPWSRALQAEKNLVVSSGQ